jgi:deoxyadenosine/deoxycytidine kinase
VHRVAKPSLVLSGDFKENRFQIKTTLENKGYTVRNSLLVGGQKDCYLVLGKNFKQSKLEEAKLAGLPVLSPTFYEAIVAKPDQVPDPSLHAYKGALPRKRQHTASRRYYSTEQKVPAKVKQCRAMTRKVVALEGQIGVGKSTLCGKIKELFSSDVAIYKEQTNELFLKLFYSNPAKYGFAFQWGMLKTRVYQLRLAQQDIKHGRHPDKQFFFWDRSMIGDYTFALWNHLLGSISREEMDVYESEFGGSMKEFDKIPFLKDIGLFVYLNDEPAQCKFRVEQHRKNDSEQGIPLPYYEGIDDMHFHLFIFKLFTNPNRSAVVLNWGQYNDAENTLDLFRNVLDGKIKAPTVQIVSKADVQAAKAASRRSDASYKFYKTEAEILAAFEEIKGEDQIDNMNEVKPAYEEVYIPMDLLTIPSEEKNIVENDYDLTFYRNEFKRVVLYHLAHFENVKLYKSQN